MISLDAITVSLLVFFALSGVVVLPWLISAMSNRKGGRKH